MEETSAGYCIWAGMAYNSAAELWLHLIGWPIILHLAQLMFKSTFVWWCLHDHPVTRLAVVTADKTFLHNHACFSGQIYAQIPGSAEGNISNYTKKKNCFPRLVIQRLSETVKSFVVDSWLLWATKQLNYLMGNSFTITLCISNKDWISPGKMPRPRSLWLLWISILSLKETLSPT